MLLSDYSLWATTIYSLLATGPSLIIRCVRQHRFWLFTVCHSNKSKYLLCAMTPSAIIHFVPQHQVWLFAVQYATASSLVIHFAPQQKICLLCATAQNIIIHFAPQHQVWLFRYIMSLHQLWFLLCSTAQQILFDRFGLKRQVWLFKFDTVPGPIGHFSTQCQICLLTVCNIIKFWLFTVWNSTYSDYSLCNTAPSQLSQYVTQHQV